MKTNRRPGSRVTSGRVTFVDAPPPSATASTPQRSGPANAKRLSDAEYYATRATQLQPTNAMAFDRLGVAMVARGIVNADTEAKFRHAVELDPTLVIAQVHLARLLKRLQRTSEAEPIYNKAIAEAKDAPTLVLIA